MLKGRSLCLSMWENRFGYSSGARLMPSALSGGRRFPTSLIFFSSLSNSCAIWPSPLILLTGLSMAQASSMIHVAMISSPDGLIFLLRRTWRPGLYMMTFLRECLTTLYPGLKCTWIILKGYRGSLGCGLERVNILGL